MSDTVRVRIAVAIDNGGDWVAYGSCGADDDDSEREVWGYGIDGDGATATVWVEADVPRPSDAVVVEGEVIQAPQP